MLFKLIFHIKLVSFKNIDIWPIYGPKSIKFGAYANYVLMVLAIFCPIWITIHIRVPKTTKIYYYNIQIYLESATLKKIKFLLFSLDYPTFFWAVLLFFELSYFFWAVLLSNFFPRKSA